MDYLMPDTSMGLVRAAEQRTKQAANLAERAKNLENIEAIENAAKEFEAVFLSEMIKPMFNDIRPNEVFGGGKGEEIFQSMMIQEYGKMMSDRGGLGIADQVKAEMIRIQEETQND
jgi:Rod binding domain-containing protein